MSRSSRGPALDCESARPFVDAYLLGELSESDGRRLATHVRGCTACAAELGGVTRVIGLLATLPIPVPAPDLDERIIVAAIAARQRRHDRRSWLSELPRLVLRGAMRTTGTLVVTIVTVALLGGAFVFAASGFIAQTAQLFPPGGTVKPEVTPTLAPTHEQTAAPTASPERGTPAPADIVVTPAPTRAPTIEPSPVASPSATPVATPSSSLEPSPSLEPTPTSAVTPTPSPIPTPTPTPTEKPRRTPPPTLAPTSSAPPADSPTSP